MTDYFAVLGQPRTPWLDPEELREAFHRKTLKAHPDVATAGEPHDFTALNEAYQVLQDPKRRLQHLLELEGTTPAAGQPIPPDLEELFLRIGETTQHANTVVQKMRDTANALSRSLLKPEVMRAEGEVERLREKVETLLDNARLQSRELTREAAWRSDVARLSELYLRLSYLGRWKAQLDELQFQLS
ncbi:MAG TPA: J domain-containing protein [Chthoniobacterales bacterium]|jgi:curved DNA-binding protein CbpA|nr:J domain-containing protein [Chthoniobacterales bacterium]